MIASSTRWLIGTVVAVLGVAIVAVVVSSVQEPAELPADSPEAVVQRYLRAVADGDSQAALDTYTDELREGCEDDGRPAPPRAHERRSFRAELVDTRTVRNDLVEVEVRITEFTGEPPLSGGGYDHRETFAVERIGGRWALSSGSWPYYMCGL